MIGGLFLSVTVLSSQGRGLSHCTGICGITCDSVSRRLKLESGQGQLRGEGTALSSFWQKVPSNVGTTLKLCEVRE